MTEAIERKLKKNVKSVLINYINKYEDDKDYQLEIIELMKSKDWVFDFYINGNKENWMNIISSNSVCIDEIMEKISDNVIPEIMSYNSMKSYFNLTYKESGVLLYNVINAGIKTNNGLWYGVTKIVAMGEPEFLVNTETNELAIKKGFNEYAIFETSDLKKINDNIKTFMDNKLKSYR